MEPHRSSNPLSAHREERAVLTVLWVAVASLMVIGILFIYMNEGLSANADTAFGGYDKHIVLKNTPIGELPGRFLP